MTFFIVSGSASYAAVMLDQSVSPPQPDTDARRTARRGRAAQVIVVPGKIVSAVK